MSAMRRGYKKQSLRMNKNHFMQKECGIYITHSLHYYCWLLLLGEEVEKMREPAMTTAT
jgi:hypothetical protein